MVTESFHYLPEDLVVNILSKLPVKSLIKFRCICKSWYSLIKSPYFVAKHLKDSQPYYLAFIDGGRSIGSLSINFFSYSTMKYSSNLDLQFNNANFVGFCNGLLCLVLSELNFYIVNPATKEYKVLKELDKPLGSPSYGFGFDPKANDYKVVRVTLEKTEVMALKSNSWKSVVMNDHSSSVMNRVHNLVDVQSHVGVKNTLHWIGRSWDREIKIIIAFDLVDEEFHDIKIPKDIQSCSDFSSHRCSVFDDRLSMSVIRKFGSDNRIEVWVMDEYGVEESWTKKYCFNMTTDLYTGVMFRYMKDGIRGAWPSHRTEFFSRIFSDKAAFDYLKIHPDYGSYFFNYSETLVPIDQEKEDQ